MTPRAGSWGGKDQRATTEEFWLVSQKKGGEETASRADLRGMRVLNQKTS